MARHAQTPTETQSAPWADVPARLAVVNTMVKELEAYLADEALERSVIAQTPQGPQSVQMSGGKLLAALHSLQGLREDMLLERKTILDGIRTHFYGIQHAHRPAFYAKLNREVQARLDQLQAFLDHCAHSSTDCRAHYGTAIRHRQIIEEIRKTLQDELIPETAQRLTTFDQRLRALTAEADFVWDNHLQPLYPPRFYWYLYRRPAAT